VENDTSTIQSTIQQQNTKAIVHHHHGVSSATSISTSTSTSSKVKQKKKKLNKPTKAFEGVGSGQSRACLRRIQSEWKDAVRLGIAYDWMAAETLTRFGRSANGRRMNNSSTTTTTTTTRSLHSRKRKRGATNNDEEIEKKDSSSTTNTVHDNSEKIVDDNDHEHDKYNYVRIGPFGKNLLRWHFSVLGPTNSVYEGGVYHGRVLLPKNYPGSPPRVQMLTPSGRFISGGDICLSASSYHPETWTPRWTILSLVDGLRLHMLTLSNEIGGLNASSETRKNYARKSRSWRLGVVDHGRMVKAGLFPLPTTRTIPDTLEEVQFIKGETKKIIPERQDDDSDKGSTTREASLSQTNSGGNDGGIVKNGNIFLILLKDIILGVVRNPVNLGFFIFLSLFIVLN